MKKVTLNTKTGAVRAVVVSKCAQLTDMYASLRLLRWICQQFLVTRSMEDFVTWVDGSKIKRAIKTYEDKVDDFDLLGEG